MKRAIVELNDCNVTVARGGAIVARSPGIAVLEQDRITLGDEALRSAYIDPRNTFTRFWGNLNQDHFKHPTRSARHNADLAFAHLLLIYELTGKADEVVFAVPGSFTTEQLSLLLGLAEAAPFSITGLIDSAVAATAATVGPGAYHYLDIYLHHSVLTSLEVSDTVNRTAVKVINDFGLMSIHDRCATFLADLFIQQSRFDPLHHAGTEQALYDRLPQCLRSLKNENEALLEIDYENTRYQARLERQSLLNALRPLYDKITGAIDPAFPCLVNRRLADLPAFVDNLANAEVLHEYAVFDGCLDYLASAPAAGCVYFVTQLKAAPNPVVNSPAAGPGPTREEPGAGATHVLVNGKAYPLRQTPCYLSVDGAVTPNKTRDSGCSIAREDAVATLNVENDSAVFIDGQRATARTGLKPGAIISFADAGIEFALIHVLD